jgi:hypothetical protein
VALERRELDPRNISPTRVDTLSKCGIAFKYQYVDGVPRQAIGSWALFGDVIHNAFEEWRRDGGNLLFLVETAWTKCTKDENGKPTAATEFIDEYRGLSRQIIRKLHQIQEQRPELKMPRRSKEFTNSKELKELNRMLAKWIPVLNDQTKWRFGPDDPLPSMFDDSLVLAKRYQHRWETILPKPWVFEFGFNVTWRGYSLNGKIDTVEPLITPDGELRGILVNDYKTDKQVPVDADEEMIAGGGVSGPGQLKDYRQLVTYDVAVRILLESGQLVLPVDVAAVLNGTIPIFVGIDYVRHQERRIWRIGEADHDRLYRELEAYRIIVENQAFLPAAKDSNADYCDYGPLCCKRTTKFAGGAAVAVPGCYPPPPPREEPDGDA